MRVLDFFREQTPPRTFISIIEELTQLADDWSDKIRKADPGTSRALVCYELFQTQTQLHDLSNSRCSSGCSACCSWKVDVTEDEAEILAEAVRTGSVKIDLDHLNSVSQYSDDSRVWKTPSHTTRCVFLGEDRSCQVYEMRPLSCRKCLVDSDPRNCSDPAQDKINPILVPELELLISLAWSLSSGRVNTLPLMLKERLDP
ncbi:MAG: YkgJ family cysteine cluster protein [Bdellovibrionales bacterium]|nr:YkgJ family cysteine cluster protein [Bdellovibrionales bacterium]